MVSRGQLTHLATVATAVVIYSLIFVPAYAATGVIAASLSVVPIAVAGWLFGRRGGLLAGVASIPLHVVLFTLAGEVGWRMVLVQWLGSLLGIVLGVAVGWLGEFVRQVQAQARDLTRERMALRAEIAERERIEHALQQAKADAETANRAKSAFLANMSHELRTPLTTIIGYCDLIRQLSTSPAYDTLAADLDRIEAAGQHLLTLIGDILDLSKVEAGKMDLYLETFGLRAFALEVTAVVQPLMARQENTFQLECAEEIGSIYADRVKVRQVLLNLLSNAAKFTVRGTITLAITRESDAEPGPSWVCFAIADTGIGIPSDFLPTLFQPFTQINATGTRQYPGTGLGLALSQRFCQLMGGSITVASTPGRGSTFTVRLPAIVDPPTS
jgi:signal transduction histidine kinase